MVKSILHNLIDLLPETDTETIYKVLIKFIPSSEPLPDEKQAILRSEKEIAAGEVIDFNSINCQ